MEADHVTAMLGFAGNKVAKFTRLPLHPRRADRAPFRRRPGQLRRRRLGRFVLRHRVPVLIGGIALLGALAIPATAIHLGSAPATTVRC